MPLVNLSHEEIELLAEALDSHAYWQLSGFHERKDATSISDSPEVEECKELEQKMYAFFRENPIAK